MLSIASYTKKGTSNSSYYKKIVFDDVLSSKVNELMFMLLPVIKFSRPKTTNRDENTTYCRMRARVPPVTGDIAGF
jgi:hypothetical protein